MIRRSARPFSMISTSVALDIPMSPTWIASQPCTFSDSVVERSIPRSSSKRVKQHPRYNFIIQILRCKLQRLADIFIGQFGILFSVLLDLGKLRPPLQPDELSTSFLLHKVDRFGFRINRYPVKLGVHCDISMG